MISRSSVCPIDLAPDTESATARFMAAAQEASRIVSFLFEADCPDSEAAKETLKLEKHLQGFFFPEGDEFDIYR